MDQCPLYSLRLFNNKAFIRKQLYFNLTGQTSVLPMFGESEGYFLFLLARFLFEYISQNQMHVRNKYPADTYCKSFHGLKFEAPKYWRSLHRALKSTEPDCQAVLQYVYTPTCVLSAWRFLRGMQVLDVLDAFGSFCILQNKGSSNKEV